MEGQEEGDVNRRGRHPLLRRPGLEADAASQRVASAIRVGIEQLVVEATVRALRLVRDVQRLEVHVDLLGDLIARGEVDLQARINERGLGAKRRVVLTLTELQQVLVTPVPRDARLEAVLVVERN